jgi:hypothetical protein
MVDRRHPVDSEAIERRALSIADRDERQPVKLREQRPQMWQIEAAVQRVYRRDRAKRGGKKAT